MRFITVEYDQTRNAEGQCSKRLRWQVGCRTDPGSVHRRPATKTFAPSYSWRPVLPERWISIGRQTRLDDRRLPSPHGLIVPSINILTGRGDGGREPSERGMLPDRDPALRKNPGSNGRKELSNQGPHPRFQRLTSPAARLCAEPSRFTAASIATEPTRQPST